jgi:DNA-binding transcriptional regulator YdaS (Cro superfamily)
MTPLANLLDLIGWTTGELAARLGVAPATVRSWCSGRREVPVAVVAWLGEVAAALARVDPPPERWHTR